MKDTNIYLKLKIIIFALILIGFIACDDTKSKVPTISVNFTIDLNDTQYYKLNSYGGYEYFTGGYAGILVYNNNGEFIAYDRACPYDINCEKVIVNDDELDNISHPKCCESEFSILYGSVRKGPATEPLKSYRCIYNENTKVLQVVN